jgi:predicted negative regulator of RcsB-dependent stress response
LPGDDRNVVAAGSSGTELSFEEQVQAFWKRNSRYILFLVALGFVAILGREAVRYMWKEREQGITEAYGASATPAELKAFAGEHSGHTLAGFALLRVADEAYKAGNFSEAATAYEQAIAPLKDSPVVSRARIGAAVSTVQAGDRTKGETALKALADDMAIMPGYRTEARYQLAVVAIGDGRFDEARQTLDDIMTSDITGSWAQRAYMLRATLPASTASAIETPASLTPAPGESSEIKLNLPGINP